MRLFSGSERALPAAGVRLALTCALVATVAWSAASATTLCVDARAHGGCYTTISEAVSHAVAGDTVNVAHGIYVEQVNITQPISLVGENAENTIILAHGLSHGIYADGLNNPGLAHVTITGLTVEGANYEGILLQNVSYATVWKNIVQENDQLLQISAGVCPGVAAYETNEGDDCGEGLHLMGVDHSVVSENLVQKNAGGILISDETAPNHDNAILDNEVLNNAYDCGITVASHSAYVLSGTAPRAFGIYHNTISGNESRHNGYGSAGGGSGIGIFAPGPGNVNVQNSVVGNRLIDNKHPGISVHNHSTFPPAAHLPNPNANDNVIAGNYISGNGADDSIPTAGPTGISVLGVTPITGLVIANNIVDNESIDIGVSSASTIDVHLNFLGGKAVGVEELNAGGTVNATENWWGCPRGPGANGCATVQGSVVYTPWLTVPPAKN